MFFFFSFEFSPNCGARSHAKLIAVQDFVFSKWFCTDIILYFKNPLPLPLPTLTHNVSITNKNKQRSCTSCRVCKIPARIIQLYKDILYITFNSTSPTSYFSFTVSLFVCVPSSETAKGKSPHIIDFLKLIVRVVSIVHQNLYLFTCSKYTTKLLFRELSAKNYFLRWLSSNVVL